MPFQNGDRVRCISHRDHYIRDAGLQLGQVYTVRTSDGDWSIHIEEDGNDWFLRADCFEAEDTLTPATLPPLPRQLVPFVPYEGPSPAIVRLLTLDEINERVAAPPHIDHDGDVHQGMIFPGQNYAYSGYFPAAWLGQSVLYRSNGTACRIGNTSTGHVRINVRLMADGRALADNECQHCGAVVDDGEEMQDGYCPSCFDALFSECAGCGVLTNTADLRDDYCSDCYDHRDVRCVECREYFPADTVQTINGEPVCAGCAEEYYNTCDSCMGTYHRDNMTYNDRRDRWLCDSCNVGSSEGIEEHDYKPTPEFHGACTDNRYFGIELELDEGGEDGDNALAIMDGNDFLYAKHDGSLSDGFEIVSHPGTLAYHLSDEAGWSGVLKRAKQNGYKSHDCGTCGLHVHISKKAFGATVAEQDLGMAKMLLVFDRQWDNILKLSRRSASQAERWAKHYCLDALPDDDAAAPLELALRNEKEKCEGGGRYQAVNLTNRHTLEVRIMRGTLNEQSFRATLQFCDALVEMVSTRTVYELMEMSWKTMRRTWFNKYPELKAYCTRRMGEDELVNNEDARPPFVVPVPVRPVRPPYSTATADDRSIINAIRNHISTWTAEQMWDMGVSRASWDGHHDHDVPGARAWMERLWTAHLASIIPEPEPVRTLTARLPVPPMPPEGSDAMTFLRECRAVAPESIEELWAMGVRNRSDYLMSPILGLGEWLESLRQSPVPTTMPTPRIPPYIGQARPETFNEFMARVQATTTTTMTYDSSERGT